MEKIYIKLLAWSITKLVNRQKTYEKRCHYFNAIINTLVDEYCKYTKEV